MYPYLKKINIQAYYRPILFKAYVEMYIWDMCASYETSISKPLNFRDSEDWVVSLSNGKLRILSGIEMKTIAHVFLFCFPCFYLCSIWVELYEITILYL